MGKRRIVYFILSLFIISSCGETYKTKINNKEPNNRYNIRYPDFEFFDIKESNKYSEYLDSQLVCLRHTMKGKLYRKDTVVYKNGIGFFLPKRSKDIIYQNESSVRVSACISDTSKNFVFRKNNSGYYLALIESNLGDSCIKVQFLLKTIKCKKIDLKVLDLLSYFNKYVVLYNEFIVIKYYYGEHDLNYKTLEDHVSWRSWSASYRKLDNSYGTIYLDLESIEQNANLMYITEG